MEEDHAPFAEKIVNMLANDEDQGGRKLLLLVMKLHLHYLPHEKYENLSLYLLRDWECCR